MNSRLPARTLTRQWRSMCHLRLQDTIRTLSTSSVRHGILGLWRTRSPMLKTGLPPRSLRKPLPQAARAPPSARARCKDPVGVVTSSQLQLLDRTGARRRLFDKKNPEAAKVGDILLVRLKGNDTFSGTCMNIRRRGIDTAILLRNELTRVGVEMWYKVFNPNVEGIEVVQRRIKRARRARLYYLRKPKHDVGSVENIVAQYIRQRQALRSGGESKGRDANSHKRHGKKK